MSIHIQIHQNLRGFHLDTLKIFVLKSLIKFMVSILGTSLKENSINYVSDAIFDKENYFLANMRRFCKFKM